MWATVFPGQGSQHIGMGKFLVDNFKLAKDVFLEASDAISMDLKKLCFDGPESDLQLTINTQPALVTVSIATWKVINSVCDLKNQAVAGHSVGEYSALTAAESIEFREAVKAVRLRGDLMQRAVPIGKGGMIAVMGLDSVQVDQLCEWATKATGNGVLEPANYNAPGQIVCSGSQEVIDWLRDHQKEAPLSPTPARLRLIPLKVSAPFHCSLMAPAEKEMRNYLIDLKFAGAKIPVVQNFSAAVETNPERLRENLIQQISGPVRWIESMNQIKARGVTKIIECGSGQVLSGLIKKCLGDDFGVYTVNSLEDLKKLESSF